METRSFRRLAAVGGLILLGSGLVYLAATPPGHPFALFAHRPDEPRMRPRVADPESWEFFRRIPWMWVTQVRVFGPAFPKVHSGEVSGVITDPPGVTGIVAGFMGLPTTGTAPPDPPETRTSGFEFEWKEPDGRIVRRTFTFNVDSKYLERRPLYVQLDRLSKRHGFGFDRTW